MIFSESGFTTYSITARFRGRAPSSRSYPREDIFAIIWSSQVICIPFSAIRFDKSWKRRVVILSIFCGVRFSYTTISSIRLRNSGRKYFLISFFISISRSFEFVSSVIRWLPIFEVMIIIVFFIFTTRPFPSVIRPSSRIWRKIFHTSLWAFSTSSRRITEYGCLRTASVNCPHSS